MPHAQARVRSRWQGYYVDRTWLLQGPQLITSHLVVPFLIDTSPDYELSFDVKLSTISANWRHLVGLTATYLDCCSYGDRIPHIAIHPLSTALRVVVGGKDGDGNKMCPFRTPPLPIGFWNRVSVKVTGLYAITYINGTAISDACLLRPRDYHESVRVDIGGEVSSVEAVDSLGALLDNVSYSRLHCASCPTSACAQGYESLRSSWADALFWSFLVSRCVFLGLVSGQRHRRDTQS